VHGAREDVAPMDPADVEALGAMCARARPRRRVAGMARLRATGPGAALRAVLARLARAGFDRAAAVDLAPRGFPLRVAKVLVPGFRVSGLL
jgi:ribosomal protein S12 methylthiotransferase accessory factor